MKKLLFPMILMILIIDLRAQDILVLNFEQFEPRLSSKSDTVYILNFWATWCKPCTEEIPDFVDLNSALKGQNVKMLFVSLDMPNAVDKRLKNFIDEYSIESEVIVLDDPDFNSWIEKVDKSWQGSIPATLVYYPGYRKFVEGSLSYDKLMRFVKPGLR